MNKEGNPCRHELEAVLRGLFAPKPAPEPDAFGGIVRLTVWLKDGRRLTGVYDEVSAALRRNFCESLPLFDRAELIHIKEGPDCPKCWTGRNTGMTILCRDCREQRERDKHDEPCTAWRYDDGVWLYGRADEDCAYCRERMDSADDA